MKVIFDQITRGYNQLFEIGASKYAQVADRRSLIVIPSHPPKLSAMNDTFMADGMMREQLLLL